MDESRNHFLAGSRLPLQARGRFSLSDLARAFQHRAPLRTRADQHASRHRLGRPRNRSCAVAHKGLRGALANGFGDGVYDTRVHWKSPSSGVDVVRRVRRHLRPLLVDPFADISRTVSELDAIRFTNVEQVHYSAGDQVHFLEIDGDTRGFLINRGTKDVDVVPSNPPVDSGFSAHRRRSPVIHSRMNVGQFVSWMLSASQRIRKLTAS